MAAILDLYPSEARRQLKALLAHRRPWKPGDREGSLDDACGQKGVEGERAGVVDVGSDEKPEK
jgi:hypothetical protein